jgi:3-methyladenine DNA glycosylase AlkD
VNAAPPEPADTPNIPGTPNVPDTALVEAIRHTLAAHGDPQRAAAQQAYMKSAMPYHGLTNSELRALLRPLLKPGIADRTMWHATIRELWDGATFREHRYAALTLARHRTSARHRLADPQASMELYRHLVTTGAWWDLVDETATQLVREQLLTTPVPTAATLRAWALDDDLWLRRAAIIAQVGTKAATDRHLLEDVILPNLEGGRHAGPHGRQDFFIRKAIGWVLRDYAYVEPQWVAAFVEAHRHEMAGLTIREALKHAT